jgi:hypothetical protein
MAGNPFVPQGTLNRLRASFVLSALPALNVTASYLGEEMVRLSFGGGGTTRINTATGQVTSPEPYIPALVRINLLKTQALANAWKAQMELTTLLGDCTIRPDAATLGPYQLSNCSMQDVEPLDFNGKAAGWIITVGGTYYINNNLWG